MPTPDPIALPELPEPAGRISRPSAENSHNRSEPYFTVRQMRAYGQACVEALTPALQVPGDMVLAPREATNLMLVAGEQALGNIDTRWEEPDMGEVYAAMLSAAPQQHGQEVKDGFHECPHCKGWSRTSAQQPAEAVAVEFDGTDSEVLREFIRLCREVKPVGQWPGERVCAAIERSMANEKPFRFIAEADMAPERGHNGRGGDADRLLSGPRRSPPPAIDIGKLRELVGRWRAEAAEARAIGQPLITFDKGQASATERRANELAALIGDGGEKGNG